MASRTINTRLGLFVGLGIVAVGSISGYWFYFQRPSVKTSLAMLAPVSEVVYGTGIVEPLRWAKVVPLQRKRLVELCHCEGQVVKVGQVLGRQDDGEERALLREIEVRRDQFDRNLERAAQDRRQDKITKAAYEQIETQFKEANSRLAAQKERLGTLVFRAPMDGMVLRRDGEVGEIVGPTDVLFWVGQPSPMQVVAEINEEEVPKIAVGQKVFLRNDAYSQALPGTVSQITPKGDSARKTFRVFLLLPDKTPLRIGMTVEVNIVYREKGAAVVVPTEAVIGNTVQVVNGGRVQRVQVAIGVRGARYVEMLNNISEGTTVLSPSRIDLADGTRIEVENNSMTQVGKAPSNPNTISAPSADQAPAAQVKYTDKEDTVIAAAMSAHVQSVVADARRNLNKYNAPRR